MEYTIRHELYPGGGAPPVASPLENDMKRFCASVAIVAAVAGSVSMKPATAAPPTVTPSPGYDARLQEQRAAQTYYEPAYAPAVPYAKPVHRRQPKRSSDGAH